MNESEYKTMVRNSFNEASEGYDAAAMRFFDKSAARLVESLPLRGAEHILDVATGTGKIALLMTSRLKAGRVMGIDLSEGMLARAQEKADRENLRNVSFQRADVHEAIFPEGNFDGFTCGFGVFFWTDMERALKTIRPWIKPGGFAAITSFADGSFLPLSDLCLKRFEAYGVQLPTTYSWKRLDHPSKHAQVLKDAGWERAESSVAQMGYFLGDALEWWDLVRYSGFRSFLNKLSTEQAEKYKEEHLREISAQATAQGIYLNVNVIFTTAFRG